MHGAVLAVDRYQLGSGRGPQGLHHRPGGDQALLVGQPEPLARSQRLDRDGQTGESDDAVDHHIGGADQIGLVSDDLDTRERCGDLGSPSLVCDGHDARSELAGLLDQRVDR